MHITIHNLETGEILTREKTSEELAQSELDKAAAEARKQAEAETAVTRQALLDRLGITADEARLLLS